MAKVTLNIDADIRQAEAKINRLEQQVARLQNPRGAARVPTQINGIDLDQIRKQAAEIQRLTKEEQKLARLAYRQQLSEATEAARQQTVVKKGEVQQFLQQEKNKQRAAELSAKQQIAAANNAARSIENIRRRQYQEFVRQEREKTRAAQTEARKRFNLDRFGGGLQNVGDGLQAGGGALTGGVTAPLAALATLGVKSALELDKARTKLIALEGDSIKAASRLNRLSNLADESIGVTREAAREGFIQLRGIGGIADASIEKVIKSLGKLNAAFNIEDQQGFIQNLNQIFTQGFERSDIKEAIGRVPFFEQLLESAFGTKDGKKLKALKDSGKLTLDTYLSGLSDAINRDPRIANIGENLTVKIAKSVERLNESLAPVGQAILDVVIPALEQIAPYIQRTAEYFNQLSPAAKTAVVAFGAFAAALGPALIVIGGLVTAIGSIASALTALTGLTTVSGVLAAVAAGLAIVGIAIAGAIGYAAALKLAWDENFGGIRDLTKRVADFIESAWNGAMAEISKFTGEMTAEIVQFWAENGAEITQAVKTVSEFIKRQWQSILAAITEFWKDHGDEITEIASAAWDAIKTIVGGGLRQVLNLVKLIAQVINGNWAGAWETAKKMVADAFAAIGRLISAGIKAVGAQIKGIVTFLLNLQNTVYAAAFNLGKNVVLGLGEGITSLVSTVYDKAKSLASGVLDTIGGVFQTQSPSKKTREIGEHVGEGLALGIENKIGRIRSAAKTAAAEALKELRAAAQEFAKLAGASPAVVQNIQQADLFRTAAGNQQEIIRLRGETGLNAGRNLPRTPAGAEAELKFLQDRKKAADDYLESLEKLREGYDELRAVEAEELKLVEDRKAALEQSGASAVLNLQREIELLGVTDGVEQQRIENYYELKLLREELMNDGFGEQQIQEILAIQKVENARLLELVKIREDRKKEIDARKEFEEKQKELAEEAQRRIREQYEETKDTILDVFDILTERGASFGERIGNLFRYITDRFKRMLFEMAAQAITNKLFGGSGGIGGLFGGLFGGGGGSSSGGGGLLGNIFGGLFGGRSTPAFNPNAGSFFSGGSGVTFQGAGSLQNTIRLPNGQTFTRGGFGGLSGGIAAAGIGANILGGLIGGRTGGFISNIGTGAALGAQIGSIVPGIGTAIGAAVGAAGGFLVSLFGGDPKRKRDKKEKLPELQKGFTDALQQLRQLAQDTRSLRVDPDSALARAQELRTAISSGFGIQFESKKYRRESQAQIAAKLLEADRLIEEIRKSADISRAAALRNNRIIPEFRDGGSISRFFSRNFAGLVPGIYDRRDDRLIRVSGNEVVLTPNQWMPITPYLKQAGVPGFANGGAQAPVNVAAPNVNLTLNMYQREDGGFDAFLQSDAGERAVKVTFNKLKKNKEI